MPGLSFQSQNSRSGFGERVHGSGAWIVPIVLVVVSIALITLCVRTEGGGVFGAVRGGVQAVTKPVESLCSAISAPLRSAGTGAPEQLEALQEENELLKTLVAELEEYRQQNQRLAALVQLSDMYALATKSAGVIGGQSGWDRTSTIDKGSDDGLRAGMGVISSCGLYGQIESVTATTSTVRLITDGNSSVGAMIQGSRARGILRGSYDGTLTLEYVSVEYKVGEGDFVITSGEGGTYPKGIIIGTVKNVEPDPSKLYNRIDVSPIFNPSACQEVLVLTGDEGEVGTIVDEKTLKAIKESMQQPSTTVMQGVIDASTARGQEAQESQQDASSEASGEPEPEQEDDGAQDEGGGS